MPDNTILVLGGTGTVGRRLVRRLADRGEPVRAASRSTVPQFAWGDPATWAPTLAGVSRLYLLSPDGVPVDPEFVALAAGSVERIVLQSSGGIEAMGDERLMAAERTVRDAGVPWTILRPSWFDQNFDEGFFRPAVEAGRLAVPVGDARQAFVDAGDIAAVAAAALTEDGHAGESYEVTGPEALTFAEAAAVIAEASGREVTFDGTPEGYAAATGRTPDEVAGEVAAFQALAAEGDAVPSGVVERVTGRPPTTFAAYARTADWP